MVAEPDSSHNISNYDMKHHIFARSLLAGACIIFTLVLVNGCKPSATSEKVEAKAALTVNLTAPQTSPWPEELAVSGSVEPWQESVVSSEVTGLKLDEVLVNVGDAVTKGQLLARFNDETTRAKLAEMVAAVQSREAALASSSDQLARSRKLAVSGTVSDETLKQNEATALGDEAQLASARAQLSAQQLTLRYTGVVAPDDGVISSRTATVGAVFPAGSELFRLIRQDRLEWRAEIPAKHLGKVVPKLSATVDAAVGLTVAGSVRQISPTVNARTLNAIAYIDLPDHGPVKAGMFLSGRVRIGESPALHVPESTLVYRDGYSYVIAVGDDSIARQIKVTTGRRRQDLVEIKGEVSESDRLVLSGGSFVNEGDRLKVVAIDENGRTKGGAR